MSFTSSSVNIENYNWCWNKILNASLLSPFFSGIGLPHPAVRSRSKGDNSLSRSNQTTPKASSPSCCEHSGNPSSLNRSLDLEENKNMSSETPSASRSVPSVVIVHTTTEENDGSSMVHYSFQTQTFSDTETIRKCFINPAVSEANMVDTCKHFEIGSGSVSHLPVS